MRDTQRRQLITAGAVFLGSVLLVGVTGCARGPSGPDTLPVPTFATSASATAGTDGAAKKTGLPDDCSVLMSPDDLGALFAQPVGTVVVNTIRGVPAPSVGRTERIACTYSNSDVRTGNALTKLVDVNIGRFTDENAARSQWQLNSDLERGGATSSDLTIGDATAVLVSRPTGTTLLVCYRLDTLTFVLPPEQGGGRPPQDVLVDLAKRMIPTLVATMPPVTTAPPADVPQPPATTASVARDTAAGARHR
ncbi:hypothetical protein ACFQ34_30335 [Pseudonocardia benzenivorans]|uniref:DUF3558 domain-containing protein n=1 Tax=Pseudonocardia benzenivorans TaxID=228005 RepID=A0ABW3VTZ6_9PSEU|nr:hypothetical protein [Pseudonocardia dioxanivorans]GJF02604.1 hypothetical protein PSD17_15670 [Pseudonocardia sp. D17]